MRRLGRRTPRSAATGSPGFLTARAGRALGTAGSTRAGSGEGTRAAAARAERGHAGWTRGRRPGAARRTARRSASPRPKTWPSWRSMRPGPRPFSPASGRVSRRSCDSCSASTGSRRWTTATRRPSSASRPPRCGGSATGGSRTSRGGSRHPRVPAANLDALRGGVCMSDPLATGLLLKLDITVWTGSAALSAPDLGLDPASIAAHYTLGRKRLVPKQALDPIATVVRQTRYALESLSHPLPDGSRFILEATAPEVEAQLGAARHASTRASRRSSRPIRPTGPRWRRSGRRPRRRPGARPAARATRPRSSRSSSPASRRPRPPSPSCAGSSTSSGGRTRSGSDGTERVELAGAADAERARRARDAAYRAEVEARIGAALERSLAGFRAQVAEACTAVLAHIQSGRPLREGTVERLRRTIRRFRALNFVDDDTLAGSSPRSSRPVSTAWTPAPCRRRPTCGRC